MRPLIIERPDLQTAAQRVGNISITVGCWLVWLYLFVPLISLFAWIFGATVAYQAIFIELRPDIALDRAASYGHGVVMLGGTFIAWATYNYLRWRGVERRLSAEPVSMEELSETFSIPVNRVAELRDAKIVTLNVDELAKMFAPAEEDLEHRLARNATQDEACTIHEAA